MKRKFSELQIDERQQHLYDTSFGVSLKHSKHRPSYHLHCDGQLCGRFPCAEPILGGFRCVDLQRIVYDIQDKELSQFMLPQRPFIISIDGVCVIARLGLIRCPVYYEILSNDYCTWLMIEEYKKDVGLKSREMMDLVYVDPIVAKEKIEQQIQQICQKLLQSCT